MSPSVILDLTRLCIGPAWRAPRGIDRVDLAYADHFLNRWDGDCAATILTPWGAQFIARPRAVKIMKVVEELWGEAHSADESSGYLEIRNALQDKGDVAIPPRAKRDVKVSAAVLNVLRNVGIPIGSSATSKIPRDSIYINTGQIGIADGKLLSWLNNRPDVRPVFMLHDTIPIDYPEFVPVLSERYHRQMIGNTARYAAGLIVTTKSAERDIRRELFRQHQFRDIRIAAAPLPPSAIFSADRSLSEPVLNEPYFVICGSIEPRKNHILLLNVWRELHQKYGALTPKLIIVGSRWSQHSDARRFIERASFLAPHVIQMTNLSTPGLASLIAGACALVMPSFAEGFGLPIVEALAARTPVIASNIPAHMEAGGTHATYVSPIDGLGWKAAIEDHLHHHAKYRAMVASYTPNKWTDYFRRIQPFLEILSGTEPECAAAAE